MPYEATDTRTRGNVPKSPSSKAAHCLVDPAGAHRCLTRAAYMEYVSSNVAKSDTSVSPKVGKRARTPLAAFFNIPQGEESVKQ